MDHDATSVVPAELCTPCYSSVRAFFDEVEAIGDPTPRTVRELQFSSTAGCPICKWLLLEIFQLQSQPQLNPADLDNELDVFVGDDVFNSWSRVRKSPANRRTNKDDKNIQLQFVAWAEHPKVKQRGRRQYDVPVGDLAVEAIPIDLSASSGRTTLPSANTGDDTTFQTIEHWISQCVSNHDLCQTPNAKAAPPSRLILLEAVDGGTVKARLVDNTLNATFRSKYLALSHRWLQGETCRLTTENVASFHDSIPVHLLKQSVRDTMTIALRLGITYIWVDSLCIIQDDDQDKEREITRMHEIYRQAFCTVVAHASDSAEVGCFKDRDPACVATFSVPLPTGKDGPTVHRVRRIETPGDRLDNAHSVTADRAWCYQERLLSSRLLRYGEMQVQWECRHCNASEAQPAGRRDRLEGSPIHSPMARLFGAPPNLEKGRQQQHHLAIQFWQDVVGDYSSCKMTHDSDKLLALSAMASFYRESIDRDRYLWGIWERTLPSGLLWKVFPALEESDADLATRFRRLPDPVAPSWSWASLGAKVHFSPPQNVIASITGPRNMPPDRILHLRTHIWTATLAGADRAGDRLVPGHPAVQTSEGYDLTLTLDSVTPFPATVTFAPIQVHSQRTGKVTPRTIWKEAGLMLVPISGRSETLCRRIGAYEKWVYDTVEYEPRGVETVLRVE